jgi:hypothetical protein
MQSGLAAQRIRYDCDIGSSPSVYGVGGERELPEHHLEHLAGFAGAPVRIGNAAYQQRQHDLMGEMILCLETIASDPAWCSRIRRRSCG